MTYCDTCGNQYSDVCGTCETLEGVPVKYKKKTNADRIRNMNDEELAVFLEKVADGCDSCPILEECTYTDGEISEEQVRLKWLKQEVSDDS